MAHLLSLNMITPEYVEGDRLALNMILDDVKHSHCTKCGGEGHLFNVCTNFGLVQRSVDGAS